MNEITYTTMDEEKEMWGPGPWLSEPDKIQWKDEATGFPCLIKRNHMGALCGYVGVSEGHPAFEVDHDSVYDLFPEWDEDGCLLVHGGLTYSDHCQEGPEAKTICHIPDPGEPDHVWWLGFDCAHAGDLIPSSRKLLEDTGLDFSSSHYGEEKYKSISYVRKEVTELARQLASLT